MRRWKMWGKICAAIGVLVLPTLLVRLGNACYLDCTLKAVEGRRCLGTFLAYLAFRLLGARPSPGKIDAAPPPPAESGET